MFDVSFPSTQGLQNSFACFNKVKIDIISLKWCWLLAHQNDILEIFAGVSKNATELLIFFILYYLITKY